MGTLAGPACPERGSSDAVRPSFLALCSRRQPASRKTRACTLIHSEINPREVKRRGCFCKEEPSNIFRCVIEWTEPAGFGQRAGLQVQAIAQQTKLSAEKPGEGRGGEQRGFSRASAPQFPSSSHHPNRSWIIIPAGPNFTPHEKLLRSIASPGQGCHFDGEEAMGELPPTLCPGTWGHPVAWAHLEGGEGWGQGSAGRSSCPLGWRASVTKLCRFPSSREPQGTSNTNLRPGKYCPGQIAASTMQRYLITVTHRLKQPFVCLHPSPEMLWAPFSPPQPAATQNMHKQQRSEFRETKTT